MRVINIHEAKTHLSRLVEEAARGDSFIIAKAGRPIARVIPFEEGAHKPQRKRTGFYSGPPVSIPDDFDRIDEDEIADLFEGS